MITLKQATFIGMAIAAGALVFSALVWSGLPATVPVHYDIHGVANGYASRAFAAAFMPALILGVTALFALLPRLSPKGWELRSSDETVAIVALVVELFLLLVHVEMLRGAREGGRFSTGALVFGTGALLALIGNRFGKLRRNFFIGIRTPWTLADPEVWLRTHRVGSKVFVALGVVVMLAAALPSTAAVAVMVAAALGASIFTVGYSYAVYRRLHPTART